MSSRKFKKEILEQLHDILAQRGLVQLGETRYFIVGGQIKMRRGDCRRTWLVSNFSYEKIEGVLNCIKTKFQI